MSSSDNVMGDEQGKVSPNIISGFVALGICFFAYIASSTSLGKRSLAHTWLFTGLLILNPVEESLKNVCSSAETSNPGNTTPKRKNSARSMACSSSNRGVRDVSALKLTCQAVLPGAIPLAAVGKDRLTFMQWQALDAAICVWLSCLLALVSPLIMAWYSLYYDQSQTPCCNDVACWKDWWTDQLGGVGVIFYQSSPPSNVMLFVLAFASIWFWWRLVIHSTQLPEGSSFRFSPFSYINGWIMLFCTLLFLSLCKSDHFNLPTDIQIKDALEEFSTRVTLWIGLTGFYRPENHQAQEQVLRNLKESIEVLFAALSSLLAFAVADPLRETMRLYWGYMFGDEVVVIDRSKGKLLRWLQALQLQYTLILVGWLPVLCLVTYFLPLSAFYGASPRMIRCILGWLFVWNVASVARPLAQNYLLQAISAADYIFDSTKKPAAAAILFPFKGRSQRVLCTGSQLLVFPAMVLLILAMGQGSGQIPVTSLDASTLREAIYPFGFYRSLWTDQDKKDYLSWTEFQIVASVQQSMYDTNYLSELSLSGAYIEKCRNNSTDVIAQAINRGLDSSKASIIQHTSPSNLLSRKDDNMMTVVKLMGNLQQTARRARHESLQTPTSDNTVSTQGQTRNRNKKISSKSSEDQITQSPSHDFFTVIEALAFHPFLTSTIVKPVLDFFGFSLSVLWMLYFAYYGIAAWLRRHEKRRYVLQVKGEHCRVVSMQK